MSTRVGKMKITKDVTGKTRLTRVHKLPAGQHKNLHGKAAKQAKKWQAKSKSK